MAAEEYVLRWNNHQQNFASVVEDLWRQDTFTDVILCSEGRVFPAHRVILSACSPYFLEMLSKVPEHQHPVVFLQGVPLKDLHALLTFMYSGEVVVSNGDLASFFRTAENLQVKGLASSSRPFNIESALRFPAAEKQAAPGIDLADQRPPVLEPLPPEPAGVESPKPRAPVPTSPQQTPPLRPLQLGSLSMDPSTQHHSMLLSSLMGARYSPPQQTSRPLPPSLLSGLASPGRRSLIPSPQIGPEVPWLPPRTPVPPAPRLALYPPPGPSYSRRGRPPSDANAANPAAGEGRETAPPVSQAQVLRVTVVTPQGPVTMFECPFCRKRFRRRDHLRQHIRTHTGEKPFECRICGRRFSQSQQVRIHMRVHSDQPLTSQGRGRGRGGLSLAGLPPSSGSNLGETLVTESDVHGRLSSRSSLSAESQSPRTSTASSPPPRPGSPPPAADSKDAATPKEESM